ncbi:hypothetical protein CCP2SC5_1160003 [Azospirillaceae bacterium]
MTASLGSVVFSANQSRRLPQLLNVLGRNGLVGPRPIVETEIDAMAWRLFLCEAKPGDRTVASQRTNDVDATRVRMDSWYVKNWTLWRHRYPPDVSVVYHRKDRNSCRPCHSDRDDQPAAPMMPNLSLVSASLILTMSARRQNREKAFGRPTCR